MKKINLILTFLLAVLLVNPSFGQVGIGTMTPDKSAALDVVSPNPENQMGVLIPRMSETDRDNIQTPANGLLIYNTDENCVNYYFKDSDGTGSWNSLCGGIGKASFEPVDCNNINVDGIYTKGVSMNGANILSIKVNVTKPGNYAVTGTTANGYGFSSSGAALNPGPFTITVPAQGTPRNEGIDVVSVVLNGIEVDCKLTPTTINVGPPTATYFVNCGGITVNPNAVFAIEQNAASNPDNTVSVPVTVTAATPQSGNITITTNTVNGVSFSGNAMAMYPGNLSVTLTPSGTLTSTAPATFNLFINSADGATTTCTFTITPVIPVVTIASWGENFYRLMQSNSTDANNYQTGNMMANPANFGPNGIVKYAGNGLTITSHALTTDIAATLKNNPPDIAFISYSITFSAQDATEVKNYLDKGGVVVFCQPENGQANTTSLLRQLYGSGVGLQGEPSGYRVYPLANNLSGDPVIDGPFKNLSGLHVMEDEAGTQYVTPVPAGVTNYSFGTTGAQLGTPIANTSFFFRDNTRNFIYIGDGGFWNFTRPQGQNYTGNSYPVQTTGGVDAVPSSRLSANTGKEIYNAYLLCNIMSWALNAATHNGIHTPK